MKWLRRRVIAYRIRRVLRNPPYFEKFLHIADRKNSTFASALQARALGETDSYKMHKRWLFT